MELQHFLAPVDNATPSGVDLRNDARFHAIERLIAPAAKENRNAPDETSPDVSTSVEWDDVQTKSIELAAEGQDLRLLVIVTRSLYHTDRFAGLAKGLDTLTKLIDGFWETLHPTLRERPTPKESALRRTNALMQLENDETGLLGDMEYLPVFTLRGLGPVTGQDLARGKMNADQVLREGPSGLGKVEQEARSAEHDELVSRVKTSCRAFASEQPEEMEALRKGVADCEAALTTLESKLSEKLGGNGAGVTFSALAKFLDRVASTLADSEDGDEEMETETTPTETAPMKGAAAKSVSTAPGTISSRKDVEKYLDMIIEFYEHTEPSSPIPHLARRMRRMVPMDFMELMNEVAPSGMKEFRNAAGVSDKGK